jgi:membrane fusion protein (multidrug efflux system)
MVAAAPAAAAPEAKPEAKTSGGKRLIFAAVGLIAVAAGGLYYIRTLSYEDTDDAQIDGNISAVSPRVSGTLKTVSVSDGQRVKEGDVLAEIDPIDYEVAVAQAKAQVAQARAQLRADEPQVEITQTSNGALLATTGADVGNAQADVAAVAADLLRAQAELAQAQANERLAAIELERTRKLIATGAVSSSELDQRSAAADAAHAATAAAEQAKAAAAARVNESRAKLAASASRANEAQKNGPRQVVNRQAAVDVRQANLDLAEAQLRQAELNLTYTKIVAPISGIVGKKSLGIGDRVQPGQELLAITQVDELWVTANFRETQLKAIHPGEVVDIHVDALGADIHGAVEAIGGATGSRFSLLPPENATGNYVKVVQRIPVRIRIDPGQPGLDQLRSGLSVEPKVHVK